VSLTAIVTVVLLSSSLCSALTMSAYARLPERRLHRDDQRKDMGPARRRRLAFNALFSTAMVFALTHLPARWLFTAAPPPLWRGALQVLGILALYDVLYYLMHRFLFHGWSVLRPVHAVHHRVRYPTTLDSLFLHPVEGLLGVGLLVFCTWVVGPVHVVTFGACLFVYSWLNIIVHAGVRLPVPYLDLLARNHAIHHVDMRSGNYASLSPLPDLVFGTAE
jgi:sterol desaturase/sphingolipid hydroxylase (fatty acid hydroxylase superfamily)